MTELKSYRASIVQVIAPAVFGGAETVVRQLIEGLSSVGVPCVTVALGVQDPGTHPWVRSLVDSGHVVSCPRPSKTSEHRALSAILRQSGVVAVHSHGYRADVAACLARRKGVRWVATAHGFTGGGFRMRAYESIDRWVLQRADQVLAVSSRLLKQLRKTPRDAERVTLVRNVPGATKRLMRAKAREALKLPAEATVVGWVGRMSFEKGADRLPGLFRAVPSKFVAAFLGDGLLREHVMAELTKLSHVDARWLGVRNDVGHLLAAFDLLVLPSRTEGMPMAVLEAMAAGTPVVGFSVGDVQYAVTRDTGWCVAADDLVAFGEALAEALRDSDERRRRREAGLKHIQTHFSQLAWVEAHCVAYGVPPKP